MNSNASRDKICSGTRELKPGNEKRPFNSEEEDSKIGFSGSKADDEGQLTL